MCASITDAKTDSVGNVVNGETQIRAYVDLFSHAESVMCAAQQVNWLNIVIAQIYRRPM